MKKSDLKTGMWVETRDGHKFMVLRDCDTYWGNEDLLFCSSGTYMLGREYSDDLVCTGGSTSPKMFDIIKVTSSNLPHRVNGNTFDCERATYVLWQREPTKQMTLSEIEAALGYPVEIVNGGTDSES